MARLDVLFEHFLRERRYLRVRRCRRALQSPAPGVISNPPSCITRLLSDGDDGYPLGHRRCPGGEWRVDAESEARRQHRPFVRKHTDRLSPRTARDARGTPGRSSAQRNLQISTGFVAKVLTKRIESVCATRGHHLCPLPSRAQRVLRDRSHTHTRWSCHAGWQLSSSKRPS